MKTAVQDLAKQIAKLALIEGGQPTCHAGVYCTKFSKTSKGRKDRWRASLAIVAQGCKEVRLGRDTVKCEAGFYTASPMELPVFSRVRGATEEKPFLALLIGLDPKLINEVAVQIDAPTASSTRAIFHGRATPQMIECATRLAKLLQRPQDAKALAPLAIRELLYHLLTGPEGAKLREFARSGTNVHRISKAMHEIKSFLSEELDVVALARSSNMSRSAFFKHFRSVSRMSPIQYQKKLRLHEARRLMIEDSQTAEGAAYAVGYKSASQFSREYSRMFGKPPSKDTRT